MHPLGQRADIAHGLNIFLKAKTQLGKLRLLIVQALLRTLFSHHVHIGVQQLQHALVVVNALFRQRYIHTEQGATTPGQTRPGRQTLGQALRLKLRQQTTAALMPHQVAQIGNRFNVIFGAVVSDGKRHTQLTQSGLGLYLHQHGQALGAEHWRLYNTVGK